MSNANSDRRTVERDDDPAQISETQRLAFVENIRTAGPAPSPFLDSLTSLVARHFDAPMAFLSLFGDQRITVKAATGLEKGSLPFAPGLCLEGLDRDGVHVVEDAARHLLARDNPMVTDTPGLLFYAGVPLVSHHGHRVGMLAVADFEPRSFGEREKEALAQFAAITINHLDLRDAKRELAGSLSRMVREVTRINRGTELLKICAWSKQVQIDGVWYSYDEFLSEILGMKVSHGLAPGVDIDSEGTARR